jgi:type I restriction enzyme S subunit
VLPLCPHVLALFLRITLTNERKNAELAALSREVARKTLNLGLLKAVSVPLPPVAEQEQIVRRVESLFSLTDTIERRVNAARMREEKLPQAILSRAFAGELVPTEAELARAEGRSYETAEVLLERIRRERAADAQPKGRNAPTRGRKKTSTAKRSN